MSGADLVFNQAKGAVTEKVRDGANVQVLILRVTSLEADATLKDRDTITDLIVTGTSREPTNAGYARKSVSNASLTVTIDDTNDRVDIDIPDQTWAAVAAGDNWAKMVICEDAGGADGTRIPLTAHSFDITPDGSDITAVIAAAGFYRAS